MKKSLPLKLLKRINVLIIFASMVTSCIQISNRLVQCVYSVVWVKGDYCVTRVVSLVVFDTARWQPYTFRKLTRCWKKEMPCKSCTISSSTHYFTTYDRYGIPHWKAPLVQAHTNVCRSLLSFSRIENTI